jgi:hypothetical protein
VLALLSDWGCRRRSNSFHHSKPDEMHPSYLYRSHQAPTSMITEYSYYRSSSKNGFGTKTLEVDSRRCDDCDYYGYTCDYCAGRLRDMQSAAEDYALGTSFGPSKRQLREQGRSSKIDKGYNYVRPFDRDSIFPRCGSSTTSSRNTRGPHDRGCTCEPCRIADWEYEEGMRRAAERARQERGSSQGSYQKLRTTKRYSQSCETCGKSGILWNAATESHECANPRCASNDDYAYEAPRAPLQLGWR